jgi:hypothetical protein
MVSQQFFFLFFFLGAVGYVLSNQALQILGKKYFDENGEISFPDNFSCRDLKFFIAIDDCILYDLPEK